MRHLTLTGYDAGLPLCGDKREGDTGWHAVWLTREQMEAYRQSDDSCPVCLTVWDDPNVEDEA